VLLLYAVENKENFGMNDKKWQGWGTSPEPGSPEERYEMSQWLKQLSDGLCANDRIIDGWKAARCAVLLIEPIPNMDTSRLDYLLQFLKVENVGDTDFCPGVVIQTDDMIYSLNTGVIKEIHSIMKEGIKSVNMRRIIDQSNMGCKWLYNNKL
jgi:hypothetical protein